MAAQGTSVVKYSALEAEQSAPYAADLKKLSSLLTKYAPHDEVFEVVKNTVHIARSSYVAEEKTFMMSLPSVCIVPQGAKQVSLASETFEYDASKIVVYAAEVPLKVKVTKASEEEPHLCLILPIDPARLHDLVMRVFPNGVPSGKSIQAVYIGDSHTKIIKSAIRMMHIIEDQEDSDLLVPLAIDEILIRLLRSPAGPAIAQLGVTDSHADKVSRAISWLKTNYAEPMKVEELAKYSGMSVSSFHTHFKSMTAMSPLQFQKSLRLNEARTLMRTKHLDVSTAALEVGYVSTSQFSREYTREFGIAPSKDSSL